MKKILFILFICIFLLEPVYASTYYSEYTPWSDKKEERVIPSELVQVQTERWYRYLKRERKNGGYFLEEQNSSEYPLIDVEDKKITPFSEWSKEIPAVEKNRIIEEREVYQYQDKKQVRYIHLSKLHGNDFIFRVPEIEVYRNETKIPYTIKSCDGCSNNFEEKIQDEEVEGNDPYIANDGNLILELEEDTPYEEIRVIIYIYDAIHNQKELYLTFTDTEKIEPYLFQIFWYRTFSLDPNHHAWPFTFTYQDMNEGVLGYKEPQISLEPMESTPTRKVEKIKQYRYQDTLYKYYQEETEITDFLPSQPQDYPERLPEFKQYFQFRTREKVVIEDNLVLDLENTFLDDFLQSNTTPVTIDDRDIDYTKNGTYPVYFHTPFMTITKQITLYTKANEQKEIQDKIKEYENKLREEEKIAIEEEITSWEQLLQYYQGQLKKVQKEMIQNQENNKNDDLAIEKQILEITKLTTEKETQQNKIVALERILSITDHEKQEYQKQLKTTTLSSGILKINPTITASLICNIILFSICFLLFIKNRRKKSNE